MSTILLTGGRAPVALELARLFHAAGHRVIVAESLPLHVCQGSLAVAANYTVPAPNPDRAGFLAGLTQIVKDEFVDFLLPTCEEIFHVAAGRDGLGCEVFAPALPQLRRLHSKLQFIRDLEARGVLVPETWEVRSEADWAALPAGRAVVLKPVFSRFAVEVIKATTGDAWPAIDASPQRPWVAQACVTGRALCTWSVARQGVLRAHSAYDAAFTAGPGASVSFQPLAHPQLEAWVRDFVAAEDFTGQLAFDLIEDDQGRLYPLECNPRATSGVHLFQPGDGLEQVLLGSDRPAFVTPRPGSAAVLGLAMWLYALPAVRSADRLGAWAQRMAGARDAVFRWDDPLPALSQLAAFGDLWLTGQRAGISAIAASTLDIEYNGDLSA